jgi:hypothetical protein
MAKKPYRPYGADLGSRSYSSNETPEERDRREYADELSDRTASLVQDEVEEIVKTRFNDDWKAAREELRKGADDAYVRAKAQALLDMEEDRIALDAKYPPRSEAERSAEREEN